MLNWPHPLTVLSDPRAYGPDGTISRHHNPFNYRKAMSYARLHAATPNPSEDRTLSKEEKYPALAEQAGGGQGFPSGQLGFLGNPAPRL
eukprot:1178053-Prorocentrum_minimum.AAC.3